MIDGMEEPSLSRPAALTDLGHVCQVSDHHRPKDKGEESDR